MKLSNEILQKLSFMYKKTHEVFSFIISCNFTFVLMNALVYVDMDQGVYKGKNKVAGNET